jgi:biofilm PGA synthesis N-glycosyltransferase PgaC
MLIFLSGSNELLWAGVMILALIQMRLMIRIRQGWRMPAGSTAILARPTPYVSVIVAARNEAHQLPACLASLLRQDYPSEFLEIIIVDDHSSDATHRLAEEAGVRVLSVPEGAFGKKAALSYGVGHSRGTLLMFTDADCVVPSEWVSRMVAFQQRLQLQAVTGPVWIPHRTDRLSTFQQLDFFSLMAVTQAGYQYDWFHLGNGANLLVTRSAFDAVEGYREGADYHSGDDVFLLQAIVRHFPGQVQFLKDAQAAVATVPEPTWTDFWRQRIRWATKSTAYSEKRITWLWVWVYLFCLAIVLSVVALPWFPWIFCVLAFTKAVTDYQVLRAVADFFGVQLSVRLFVPAQLIHIIYVLKTGTLGLFQTTYIWKGRRLR